jgi:hypothetical protein
MDYFKRIVSAILLVLVVFSVAGAAAKKKKKPSAPKLAPRVSVEKKDQICFTMYTLNEKTLKMTAQLYPLDDADSREIYLEVEADGSWRRVASSRIREDEYTSPKDAKAWNTLFRVEDWDDSRAWKYRVVALGGIADYEGIVRKNPVDKEEIVVASFTGNSNKNREMRDDIVKNVTIQNPDLLFFSGDQSYDHEDHLGAWLLFGRQFGELTRNIPTVAIPDDHDVGQANIWGAAGKKAKTSHGNTGGYFMDPQYVREVEFAQTANLPDPFDATPVQRGIGVYYTSLNIGGIDFAIIEDRKFKSGPNGLVPPHKGRSDHINDAEYDISKVDVKGAVLLGERQLDFLEQWGKDWKNVKMKCVLSATIFANAAHLHSGKRLIADMDSNGWPQTGRKKAVSAIRKSFSLMLSGDQHLATVIHHGVDEFDDSGYSFCVPSIVNHYPRIWSPLGEPVRKIDSPLKLTGSYYDGFKNKLTMYAYANPGENKSITSSKLVGRAAGYGIVRFNKKTRKITMECWPRGVDLSKPDQPQYKGWPVVIDQEDNYGRKAVAYLPTITVDGLVDPIVQVIDESNGETVYTICANGKSFRPKVFKKGSYTVIVGDQIGKEKKLENISSLDVSETASIKVVF